MRALLSWLKQPGLYCASSVMALLQKKENRQFQFWLAFYAQPWTTTWPAATPDFQHAMNSLEELADTLVIYIDKLSHIIWRRESVLCVEPTQQRPQRHLQRLLLDDLDQLVNLRNAVS